MCFFQKLMMMKNYIQIINFSRRSPTTYTHSTADNKTKLETQQKYHKYKESTRDSIRRPPFLHLFKEIDELSNLLFTYRDLENDIWKFEKKTATKER